jgi:hypothetical protein
MTGGAPYPSIAARNLHRQLRRGYRMEKPDMCSDEVYVYLALADTSKRLRMRAYQNVFLEFKRVLV